MLKLPQKGGEIPPTIKYGVVKVNASEVETAEEICKRVTEHKNNLVKKWLEEALREVNK
jgi:hypothetical protein